jgi:hypothetical protein
MPSRRNSQIRQQSCTFAALEGQGRIVQLNLWGAQHMQGEAGGHISSSLPPEIISLKFTQFLQEGYFETLSETARRRAIRKLGSSSTNSKGEKMNKFFKPLSLIVVMVLVTLALGAGTVRALREAAAPLPYGLTAQDTMASVEYKLGQPVEIHAPQAGWKPGLPDEGFSPDHAHYWAIYRRFGLTVVYNTPSASDKNATIYAIYVND